MADRVIPDDVAACCCGSMVNHDRCCGRYLGGGEFPQSAEQLMRSRYSAYVLGDEPYLLATWHPDTRPGRGVRLDSSASSVSG